MNKPLLSVCLITYNHANYIHEAIDNVLNQRVSFPFELIIADDFSTDGTREIILEYQKKNPEKIKLLLQNENIGAAKNWYQLINFPKTKYIAYLEGDDYWTDPMKLQKQIDILESNPHISLCFHAVNERYEGTSEMKVFTNIQTRPYEGSEILQEWVIPSVSIVFRQEIINDARFTEYLLSSQIIYGDIILLLITAEHGKIFGMSDVMAVYRRHPKSFTQLQPNKEKMKKMLHHYKFIGQKFDKKYIKIANKLTIERAYYYGHTCILKMNIIWALYFYFYAFKISPLHFFQIVFKDIKKRLKK